MNSKPQMVFIHGWGLHSAIWQPLIEQLADQLDCHCLDLPGYGNRADDTAPDNLEALAEGLLSRAPEQAHWCGWSLGGMAAMQAALTSTNRIQSLSLICSTPRFMRTDNWPLGMPRQIFSKFADELEADYHSGIRKFLLLQAGAGSVARDAAKQAADLLKSQPAPQPQTLRNGLHILATADLRTRLGELDIPCTIVSGRRDRVIHPEVGAQLGSALPQAGLVELNSGHAPHLSHTAELADILSQPPRGAR